MDGIDLPRIEAAQRVLEPVIRRTPIVPSRVLSETTGHEVRLECENLQRTGSFKPRGAYLRITNLPADVRARGVVAASAGNHAQGVAWAASESGIEATVFMPVGASLPKLTATRAYGARVVQIGESVDEALVAATEFAERTGATLIHPFDHADVAAGQGTVGLELLQQFPEVGTVLVPTGGGGLLAGVATALAAAAPHVRVVGAQAAQAAAWPGSLAAGTPVALSAMSTMADGIAVGKPGAVPFAQVQAAGPRIVTVGEEALSRALVLLLERAKLVVEPSGAAAVAALQSYSAAELELTGAVCAILSGGNIDPLLLTRLIGHGLAAAGRYLTVRVTVADRPGSLGQLLALVGRTGADVVEITHSRIGDRLAVDEADVSITLETRGPAHRDDLPATLHDAGYVVRVQD